MHWRKIYKGEGGIGLNNNKMVRKEQGLVGLAILIMLLAIPIVFAATTGNLGATLTIGNSAPTVPLVICSSVTPTAGGGSNTTCIFNVTDANGINDISMTGHYVNMTNGTTMINSTICNNMLNDSAQNTAQFNCTIQVEYFIEPYGLWNITVNATDGTAWGSNSTTDTALTNITVNSLTALSIASPDANITFGSVTPGTNDNAASNDPVILNNTGNQHITQVNISANNLTGADDSEWIWAGNFTANDADAAAGETLAEETFVNVDGIVLSVGVPTASQDSVYLYVDVANGLSQQEFSATMSGRDWVWGIGT